MICIDFQGGTHGNYLEFVCNKFLAHVPTANKTPFDKQGAAHNKKYLGDLIFKSYHYFDLDGIRTVPESGDIISIRITENDLLPLQAISLLRAGGYNYDNNFLESDTVAKLSIPSYMKMLDYISNSFFKDQIKESYCAVKDPSWPDVETLEDFKKLPNWIQDECKNVHGLYLLDLSSGECPRWVLREFFKLGFATPEKNGFMVAQKEKMYYNPANRVYNFKFENFYNVETFLMEIRNIARWANMPFSDNRELIELHLEFLSRQPYAKSKQECDQLVQKIISEENFVLPALDLLKESYICAMLEKHYKKSWPTGPDSWFKTSQDILKYMQT